MIILRILLVFNFTLLLTSLTIFTVGSTLRCNSINFGKFENFAFRGGSRKHNQCLMLCFLLYFVIQTLQFLRFFTIFTFFYVSLRSTNFW